MTHRCGTIGLAGRPNTGKSSLLNRLVGQKLSIVSGKPQTTRHLVTGIVTQPGCQFVFVDAPGQQARSRSMLHRTLNRRATQARAMPTSRSSWSRRCASDPTTTRSWTRFLPSSESSRS
jgi:small GTP-binding protein